MSFCARLRARRASVYFVLLVRVPNLSFLLLLSPSTFISHACMPNTTVNADVRSTVIAAER
jgi:hypothetical protein